MLSPSRAVPGQRVPLLRLWFWTDPSHGLRVRGCSASYSSAAAKTRSGLDSAQTGLTRLTHRQRQDRMRQRCKRIRLGV
ncbi:uncharacterized protein V6R79_008053 [Siganus canaliculatus]